MKLSIAIPKNDIDNSFEYQTIIEDASDVLLKEKGFDYAETKGEDRKTLCWHGNVVMGDTPVHPVKKWTMDLSDGSILTIE